MWLKSYKSNLFKFLVAAMVICTGSWPPLLAFGQNLENSESELLAEKPISDIQQKNKNEYKSLREIEIDLFALSDEKISSLESSIIRQYQNAPKNPYVNFLLAVYYTKQYEVDRINVKKLRQATKIARHTTELSPKSAFGYLSLSYIALAIGQTPKAQEIFKIVESKIGVKRNIGFHYIKYKINSSSISYEEKLAEMRALLQSSAIPSTMKKKLLYPTAEDISPSVFIEETKKWGDLLKEPLLSFLIGRAYHRNKNYSKAHELYNQAIAQNFRDLDLLVEDGVLLTYKLNQPKAAIERLQSALKIAKEENVYFGLLAADIHLHLGAAFIEVGKIDEAIESHFISLREFENKNELLKVIYSKYRSKEAYSALQKLLSKINLEIPGQSLSYAMLADTLNHDLEKPELSLTSYADAITLEPSNLDFYNGMGLAYYKLNNYESALNVFHLALEIDPTHATSHYNLACVRALLGQKQLALDSLAKAIALDPTFRRLALEDQDLLSLHTAPQFITMTKDQFAH